jgi:hypothetical protein
MAEVAVLLKLGPTSGATFPIGLTITYKAGLFFALNTFSSSFTVTISAGPDYC